MILYIILILSYTYHTPSLRKSFKLGFASRSLEHFYAGLADAPPVRRIRLHLFEMPSKNTIHGSLDMFSPQHGSCTKSVPSNPGSVEPDAMVPRSLLDLATGSSLFVDQPGDSMATLHPRALPFWEHCRATRGAATKDPGHRKVMEGAVFEVSF